jgi:hypothetical protein
VTNPATLARAVVGLGAAGVAVLVGVALLGPSAASAEFDGSGPNRTLALAPADGVVAVGMWVGLVCCAGSVLCAWFALRRGWEPSVRRVVLVGLLGAALLAAVPPLGSTDVLSYAAYGRMVVVGQNPYTTTVNDLIAQGDPIGKDYDGAWPDVPAVYGPVGVGVQGAVSWLSGTSMRWFALIFQLVALAAFAATAALLLRGAQGPAARRRVAVLWTGNPLLMYLVVNSAHIDVVAVALGLAGLLLLQRSPVVAAVLAVLATCTKVSFALYALAMLWALRRSRAALLRLVVAGGLTTAVLVAPFLPELIAPLGTASQYVARESLWWLVSEVAELLVPSAALPRLLSVAGWVLMAFVVWRLRLLLPRRASLRPTPPSVVDEALWVSALLGTAWLLSSTYVLPWYDVLAWAPLLLLPASAVDLIVLTRTALVSVGYAPGVVIRPNGWAGPVSATLRGFLAPAATWVLVIVSLVAPRRLRPRPRAEGPPRASSR